MASRAPHGSSSSRISGCTIAPARRTQGFSSAARFAGRTADSEAATAAKNPRRRLDSGTGPPFLAGDPCKCVAWITPAISWPPHCQRPLFNRPSLPTAGIDDDDPLRIVFLKSLTVFAVLPWFRLAMAFSAAQAASAMTLPCNGLGKYDSWTTTMRFRQKTFQGKPQKGNSSSSGPYEAGLALLEKAGCEPGPFLSVGNHRRPSVPFLPRPEPKRFFC